MRIRERADDEHATLKMYSKLTVERSLLVADLTCVKCPKSLKFSIFQLQIVKLRKKLAFFPLYIHFFVHKW